MLLLANGTTPWYGRGPATVAGSTPPPTALRGTFALFASGVPQWVRYDQVLEQRYRVADSSLALYELYVGEDAAVDFSASGQPVATSATLPFSWTPTPPASGSTKVLHVVVRQRNAYNLQSFNVFESLVEIDSAGAQLLGPLTAPVDVDLYDPLTSGDVRVLATYNKDDDANPADTWEVYGTVGADPSPGVDTPLYSGTMSFLGNMSFLAQTISDSSFGAGDTLHVIVTVMRASDSERASASVEQITLAASLDLTDGQAFGGSFYEQR